MVYTLENVGTRKRGGKSTIIPDVEKQALVDKWNASEIKDQAEEIKEVRENLIKQRMHQIAYTQAEQELITDGIIK